MAGRSTAIRGLTDGLRTFTNVTVWRWGFGRRPIATVGRAPGPSSEPFKSQVRPEFTEFPTFRNRADSTYTGAVGHVVDGSGLARFSSRVQQWSEQPSVRPVSAVHVTAGHNARRGIRSRLIPRIRPCWRNEHRSVLWPKWVVLIAGSTVSALRAVRPFRTAAVTSDRTTNMRV
jgi:hypothetical protein